MLSREEPLGFCHVAVLINRLLALMQSCVSQLIATCNAYIQHQHVSRDALPANLRGFLNVSMHSPHCHNLHIVGACPPQSSHDAIQVQATSACDSLVSRQMGVEYCLLEISMLHNACRLVTVASSPTWIAISGHTCRNATCGRAS